MSSFQPTLKSYKEKLYRAERNYNDAKACLVLMGIMMPILIYLSIFLMNVYGNIERVDLVVDTYSTKNLIGRRGGNIITTSSYVSFHFTPQSDNTTRKCSMTLSSMKYSIDLAEKDTYKVGNIIKGYFMSDGCFLDIPLSSKIYYWIFCLMGVFSVCVIFYMVFCYITTRNEVYSINKKLHEIDPVILQKRKQHYTSGEFICIDGDSPV